VLRGGATSVAGIIRIFLSADLLVFEAPWWLRVRC
jgi:hypothetical protein